MSKELTWGISTALIAFLSWIIVVYKTRKTRPRYNFITGIIGGILMALGLFLLCTKHPLVAIIAIFLGMSEMIYSEIRDSLQKFFPEDSAITKTKGVQMCRRMLIAYGILGVFSFIFGALCLFGVIWPSKPHTRMDGISLIFFGGICIMLAGVHEVIVRVVRDVLDKQPTDKLS